MGVGKILIGEKVETFFVDFFNCDNDMASNILKNMDFYWYKVYSWHS